MSGEPKEVQKGFLWRLHTASRKNLRVSGIVPYCGHETTEEQLEGKLWQYAEASMPEGESERFWGQVQGCKYCLQKLLAIQQAVKQASREKSYSLGRIKELIKQESNSPVKQESGSNVLRIALNWIKDSLELISTSGSLLPPEPIPVMRGTAPEPPQIIRIDKEFEKCKVEVSAQKAGSQNCNIEVKIILPQNQQLPDNFKVNLFSPRRLLAASSLVKNKIDFDNIAPGNYRVELKEGTDLWGRIFLDIS
jgi:hypothetical protein